jgi:hypothetical protein
MESALGGEPPLVADLGGDGEEEGDVCRDFFSAGSFDALGTGADDASNEAKEAPKSGAGFGVGVGDSAFSTDLVLTSEALDFSGANFLSGAVASTDEKGLSVVFALASSLPKIDPPSGPTKGLIVAGPSGVAKAKALARGTAFSLIGGFDFGVERLNVFPDCATFSVDSVEGIVKEAGS